MPFDPFAADDSKLRYLPHGIPPLLYSVGPNSVDDGGKFELRAGGSVDARALDMPFFLDGDRPCPPPPQIYGRDEGPASTQAVEDDEEVEGDEQEDREQEAQQHGECEQ